MKNNNNKPLRMCVACRSMKEKQFLIKVVKNMDGKLEIDLKNKKPGRGAYICNNLSCLETAQKKHTFNYAFKCNVGNEIYDELKGCIKNAE